MQPWHAVILTIIVGVIILVGVVLLLVRLFKPKPKQPAGWYADPNDLALMRYFDGQAWTEATQPPQ